MGTFPLSFQYSGTYKSDLKWEQSHKLRTITLGGVFFNKRYASFHVKTEK